ncbi:hypothetical protein ACFL3V_04940 [Nanoarchaeota archaeon]
MSKEKELMDKLEWLNKNAPSPPLHKHDAKFYAGTTLFISLMAIFLFIIGYHGPEFTGFVTFSESVVSNDNQDLQVTATGTRTITTDLNNINSIMLSGTVYGNGKAAVYVQKPDRRYLAYYFEGNAAQGTTFKDMCYDTCHMENLEKDTTLLFELDNTRIDIENIKYLYSRIIDFDLEPRTVTIQYNNNPASIVNLKLTNNEQSDYTVLLYIDGPLSSSFSWQGSLIHMEKDIPEKTIPITVKLPSNLPKGEYTHKVTARYVPPGTYEFIGESPVAETFITVYNN